MRSVNNALLLLLLFRDHDVLRVTDVSNELSLARSTAHRLLMTLAHQGFVQQERNSRSYRAGPSLMEFALSTTVLGDLRNVAHPHIVAISRKLDETINLMILEGENVRFVDSVEGDRPVRVTARPGTVLPAHATAGGKVLLAAIETGEARTRAATGLSRMTPVTITKRSAFLEELDDVRRLGYAVNRGESLDGLRAAAVPIVNDSGRCVASLAVSVPADRGTGALLRKLVPSLRTAAADIGQLL